MSKKLYELYPPKPPYCPMEACTCLLHSLDGDEPYDPGRSIFCLGKAEKPVQQEWFGTEHINDVFMCTWFPRGWERSLINITDIEIMLAMFLTAYPEINSNKTRINPTWLLNKAGHNDLVKILKSVNE